MTDKNILVCDQDWPYAPFIATKEEMMVYFRGMREGDHREDKTSNDKYYVIATDPNTKTTYLIPIVFKMTMIGDSDSQGNYVYYIANAGEKVVVSGIPVYHANF
jgi:phage portal protein BeeE